MPSPATVALLVYDRVQILEVTGPASVFGAANDALGHQHYDVQILSAFGGIVHSNCAANLDSRPLSAVCPESLDTILIPSGTWPALREFGACEPVRPWVMRAAKAARRVGAICIGTFLLADFGLIEGKTITTHLSACAELAAKYPSVNVNADALYIEDRGIWTSAGVTAGIDMSLAMVERDLGSRIAQTIAERLVLHARRPGHQSQRSPLLSAQARSCMPFAQLVDWMSTNITKPLDVPVLAARVAMSERTFYRKFTENLGETPARFVESLRLDRVRTLLGSVDRLKEIVAHTGFSSEAQLSKAFERRFGISPQMFRDRHHAS